MLPLGWWNSQRNSIISYTSYPFSTGFQSERRLDFHSSWWWLLFFFFGRGVREGRGNSYCLVFWTLVRVFPQTGEVLSVPTCPVGLYSIPLYMCFRNRRKLCILWVLCCISLQLFHTHKHSWCDPVATEVNGSLSFDFSRYWLRPKCLNLDFKGGDSNLHVLHTAVMPV